MPHFASKDIDRKSFSNLLNDLAQTKGASSYKDASPLVQHGIRIDAAQIYRPRYRANKNSDFKDQVQYQTGADYQIIDRKIVYIGAFAGVSLDDLNRNAKRDSPDQYDEKDTLLSLLAQEAIGTEGATQVVLIYPREGEDNRDITIMEYDPKTNIGKTSIINTAPDGKSHSFEEAVNIAKQYFPQFDAVAPDDHIFMLSDKIIPREKIAKVIQEFKMKEQGLEITETKMRLDPANGKVFTKDQAGQEIDIESLALTEAERKQKHRLVGKIKSCQVCATETGKTEAFFYAPDNLTGEEKPREVSQILVDPKGNATFQTIKLSKDLTNPDLKRLLLKLGTKKEKTPREFSYAEPDPLSREEIQKRITEELTSLQNRSKFEFISLRVFSVADRFDFLRERFNSDRIITNSPTLYFHDIVVSKGKINEEDKVEKNDVLRALVVINSNESPYQKIKFKKIGEKRRVSFFDEESDGPGRNPNQGGAGEVMDGARKSKRHQNSHSDNGGGGASPPTVNLYLDEQEDDIESKRRKNEEGKTTPENPAPQTPSKLHFEEEVIHQRQYLVIDSVNQSPSSASPAPESSSARSSTTISSLLFEINHIEHVEHIKIRREEQVEEPTEQSEKRIKPPEKNTEEVETVERTVIKAEAVQESKEVPFADKKAVQRVTRDSWSKTNIVRSEIIPEKNEATYIHELVPSLIFPFIRNPFPIGERVDIEKIQMEEIWEMFLQLYFAVLTGAESGQEKKKRMLVVAEQEIKTGANFFAQPQFENYTRILAILFISILTFSRGI